jgi:hypothetical protein
MFRDSSAFRTWPVLFYILEKKRKRKEEKKMGARRKII